MNAIAGSAGRRTSNARPSATRIGRIAEYLAEMFPPLLCIPAAAVNFATVYFSVQALGGRAPLGVTWRGIAGALSTILFFLLLRVYDELKDVETDLRLGRAGDPRYKDRAIVTGRILVSDLRALRWFVTVLLVGINLPLGFPVPLLVFAAAFLWTWLSFHWFFWKAVARNLLLAFVTHNPMALAVGAYAAAVAIRDFGPVLDMKPLMVLLVGLWTSIAAWEVSRKIRIPRDETEYTTYSKILGWRLAGMLPSLFVLVSAACLAWAALAVGLSSIYLAILWISAATVVVACLRFELHPTTASANLRPYAESYSLVAVAGFSVALLVRFSITIT